MEPERWRQIESLFHSALKGEKSRRTAFLEQACAGDEALRQEVELLLAQQEKTDGFLEAPALEVAAQALARDHAQVAGAPPHGNQELGEAIFDHRAAGRTDDAGIPPVSGTGAESFHGTERFELRRRLGSGGFGVVYEAYDREHNATVALKTLQRMGAESLYRFKREFRALTNITHPNLIALYELIADREHWFFIMELVDGVDFLSYILHGAPSADHMPRFSTPRHFRPDSSGTPQQAGAQSGAGSPVALPNDRLRFDMDRLRQAFRQLSEGVRALHEAGKLHCDLKPSNVLVERSGRVVILDFGLVAESDSVAPVENSFLFGTPDYMSPEQARGIAPSPASDWYCVGVMLFEAFTEQRPFRGTVREILEHKRSRDAPAPLDLVSGLPQDLNDLCCRLLARDPKRRPSAGEVLDCLGDVRPDLGEASRTRPSSAFIGREHDLSVLREAFESTRAGQLVTVWVHGPSGVGKTALVRRFLDEVRQQSDAVVLDGRCYERETVPYKALDGLADSLGRYVVNLPPPEAKALMPLDLSVLIRLFPVLREWGALRGPRAEVVDVPDLKELRRRGFAAFRQVLDGIAVRKPVVLFIDDLQWGDSDSVTLLTDLIKGGDTAALLFIACYRGEESESSPLLSRLLPLRDGPGGASSTVDLELQELNPPQAAELAASLLNDPQPTSISLAATIAREAGGNPFFIGELVRYTEIRGETHTTDSILSEGGFWEDTVKFAAPSTGTEAQMKVRALNDVIRGRYSSLSTQTRRLLEVVAVAGQPVDLRVAKRAAGISSGGHAELNQLRAVHLIRTRQTEGAEQVEAYHDRIRQATEAGIDSETLKQHHYQLAIEWEASTLAEPRALAVHFRGAGITDKAFHYAVEAADQSAGALAFGSAAESYRFALELKPGDTTAIQALRVKLGDALSNAGRGEESAEAYLAEANRLKGTLPLGQLAQTTEVENYPGFPYVDALVFSEFSRSALPGERYASLRDLYEGRHAHRGKRAVFGPEIMEYMRQQALNFGARVVTDDVVDAELRQHPFVLTASEGSRTEALALVIATGAHAQYLGVPSEERFRNNGVSACAVCDGALSRFRGKQLVVVGGGDSAVEEAIYLSRFSAMVRVVHRRDQLRASKIMQQRLASNPKIEMKWNRVVTEVLGNDEEGVTAVRLRSSVDNVVEEITASGMFVAIGHTPNTDFLKGQLELDEKGYIRWQQINRTHTSIGGVFAAGDVADNHYRQAVSAAGTGCMAALDAERWLATRGFAE